MSIQRRSILGAGAMGGLLAATGVPADATPPGAPSDEALARSLPGDFRDGYATVNGVRLHYVTGGQGRPLVLLPGWPRTWWEFHLAMPALARTNRVFAVDLRGMGRSAKPADGYDKKTMAADIAALVRHLGYDQVDVVGSDIGAMVGFSFAANHPELVRRLVLLDVPHPEEGMYQLTLIPRPDTFHLWWFAFNQARGLPEQLLAGRARLLIDYMCDLNLVNPDSVTERDREIYARAYDTEDAIRAGNGWYQAFGQDIADDRTYLPVTAPLLALAHHGNYPTLRELLPTKATDVRVTLIENSGHYLVEEQPAEVVAEITAFLT
ncbi:alpha/beta fold hydrolase [Actinophytocola sediminis]